MFCSLCPEVDVNEAGHNRSRSIAILRNGKTVKISIIIKCRRTFTWKIAGRPPLTFPYLRIEPTVIMITNF